MGQCGERIENGEGVRKWRVGRDRSHNVGKGCLCVEKGWGYQGTGAVGSGEGKKGFKGRGRG